MNIESETVIELANQFGLAAEHIFDIFVSAQLTLGIISGMLFLISLIILILIYKYIYKIKNDNGWEPVIFIMVMACCILFIGNCVIYNILICIFLPEYSGALELINLLTNN